MAFFSRYQETREGVVIAQQRCVPRSLGGVQVVILECEDFPLQPSINFTQGIFAGRKIWWAETLTWHDVVPHHKALSSST